MYRLLRVRIGMDAEGSRMNQLRTNDASRSLRMALLTSLGIGLLFASLHMACLTWQSQMIANCALLSALVCYAISAVYFRRAYVIILSSMIIAACFTTAIVIFFEWPHRGFLSFSHVSNLVSKFGIQFLIVNVIAGTIGFGIGTRRRRRLRRESNSCSTCGYSQVGLATALCPECGSAWNTKPAENPS